MGTIAISGITDFTASLRRKIGDPTAAVYQSTSLDLYGADGFSYIESVQPLGYVITFTGGVPFVTPEPDNVGKQAALLAAEWIVKNDRAMQLIGNAIAARDGAQSIDTSKAVNAAVDMAEAASKQLKAFLDELQYVILTSGGAGGIVNNYDENDIDATDYGYRL